MAATEKAIKAGSTMQMTNNEGPMVDFSSQNLHKLEPNFSCPSDTHTLILDQNHIIKLEYLEKSQALQQLSVASNRLVRMMGVSRLTDLRILNLPNNSIGYIEGLKDLVHLEWLNLAGNNIKVMEQLNSCVALQHLDLSDNNISQIGDLTKLSALKTVLLHGNIITTLRTVPAHLPPNLAVLSLAENEIRDLNEMSHLAPLHDLEQLSVMSNPCVMATPSLPGCDYRPYVVSWCMNLKVLDGYVVSQKEGLKAEWLYSQGKGRTYRPGQHMQLVQYLAAVCPLTSTSALQSAEDAKLERILSKQRQHQRQLLQMSPRGSPSPPRPTQLDVEQLRPDPPRDAAAEPPAPIRQADPVVQVNAWLGRDPCYTLAQRGPLSGGELVLEDVQTDEEKLHGSLLSSESAFLPVSSAARSPPSRSDSDEEPDEPDSLAPEGPARPRSTAEPIKRESRAAQGRGAATHTLISTNTCHIPAAGGLSQTDGANHSLLDGDQCSQTDGRPHLRMNGDWRAPSDGEAAPKGFHNCVEAELKREEKAARGRPSVAAVKIQAWWRGLWTRRCHPLAKEVRSEIRLRRMQEHIVFLSSELERVRRQQEEERLQRLVQEEAVKFLWKQLQSMLEWQSSVKEQLSPSRSSTLGPSVCPGPPPTDKDAAAPTRSELSLPESGFHSPGERQGALEDSFSSTATGGSPETVRSLGAVRSPGPAGGSHDGSLLEQYLSSVQQQEQEEEDGEEVARDRTGTPLCPASLSPLTGPDSSPRIEETGRQCPLLEAEV